MKKSSASQIANEFEATMNDLYRGIIMEHCRSSPNRHAVNSANLIAEGKNPLCGDEVRIEIRLDEDVIKEVGFLGEGCAISIAAASMFTGMLRDKTLQEAENLIRDFSHYIKGDRKGVDEDKLEDLVALDGVSRFPVRIKCALLPFMAMKEAMSGRR